AMFLLFATVPATAVIYPLSLHDALPILLAGCVGRVGRRRRSVRARAARHRVDEIDGATHRAGVADAQVEGALGAEAVAGHLTVLAAPRPDEGEGVDARAARPLHLRDG